MKHLIGFTFGLLLSQQALAYRTKLISVENLAFPGSSLSLYTNPEKDLIQKAKEQCQSFAMQLASISDVNIRVLADFRTENDPEFGEYLQATTYPQILATAEVLCIQSEPKGVLK